MIKEVTIYSNGDSNDLKTWSNVPYLFCKTLEEKGIKVNRVNIHANKKLLRIFNSFFFLIFRRILKRDTSPTLYRTLLHRWLINKRLNKATKAYPNTDLNIFLTYLFINPYSTKPNILWCDWSDRMVLERSGLQEKWYERKALKKEDNVIKEADLVYTMFPICKKEMEKMYGREFRYLGINVVNSLYKGKFDLKETIDIRFNSNHILFIGGMNYKYSAISLIRALDKYNLERENQKLILDIIGLDDKQLNIEINQEYINCHGYLDKSNKDQRDKYYKLLLSSKIYINPSKKWGAYSSCVEAMYYGCPIIVSPYEDFVENFGNKIEFGYYLKNEDMLPILLDRIFSLNKTEYSKLCENSHNIVKDYTWDNYIDLIIKDIDSALT